MNEFFFYFGKKKKKSVKGQLARGTFSVADSRRTRWKGEERYPYIYAAMHLTSHLAPYISNAASDSKQTDTSSSLAND